MFSGAVAVDNECMKQTDLSLDLTNRRTRKRVFLDEMERVVPWKEFVALITPHAQAGVTLDFSRPGKPTDNAFTENHRQFLLSLVRAEPDWSLVPYEHLRELPAIRWKLQNLEALKKKNPARFAQQESLLREHFVKPDSGNAQS
ncbi:hypothetical protein ACH51_17715 (plasmid) [Ralstonia solanacearum]|nr:hypothetical protein ACH51_17715 [Ralstonia solanacearum]